MNTQDAKRILIVDDEDPVRTICVRMLRPRGYQVDTAANADQAMTFLEKNSVELVITDYKMPGEMDGLALGQAIKRRFPKTKVILMTAFPDVDTAVGTLRLGALDYLVKPFDQEDLIRCVSTCFSAPAV